MADYVELLETVLASRLDELAEKIERELKSEISSRVGKKSSVSTGKAAASVHIEQDSATTRFIGARINWGAKHGEDGGMHLYYFDQGNRGNGQDGRIHAKNSKGLHMMHLKGGPIWRKSASTYGGSHVIKDVADRHR